MRKLLSIALISALIVSVTPLTEINLGSSNSGLVYAAEVIPIDEEHFPDAGFRYYLTSAFGSSFSPTSVTALDLSKLGITSLEGIQYFTALKSLKCTYCNLSSLDVSHNTALEELYCSNNKLSSLDVSHNTALKYLNCGSNNLSSLDVSHNTALVVLDCSFNYHLSSLDVSHNDALWDLTCYNNDNLVKLYVGKESPVYCRCDDGVEIIHVDGTNIIPIDEEHFPDAAFRAYLIEKYGSSFNPTKVIELCITGVPVESLEGIQYFTALKDLNCSYCNLSSLDVSHNTALESLNCCSSNLSSLDVSHNTALKDLECGHNNLSSLDVSNNTVLEKLYCYDNNLSSLDIRRNTALKNLDCGSNNLSSLDVSYNTELVTLDCYSNNLNSLNVNYLADLKTLWCSDNKLSSLDVSHNPALTYLQCDNNNLGKLYAGKELPVSCYYDDGVEIIYTIVPELREFSTTYNKKLRKYSGNEGFCYEDSYFHTIASKYNHSLATMSLCMAFSAYGYGSYESYDVNIKKLMQDCGFEQYKQYHFNEKPEGDYIGCAISSKDLVVDGNDITLIAVAVRGGGYESEWSSNFNMGPSEDHFGFDLNAQRVRDYVANYISENYISGDIKIWITGYSRGAAVATQAAAKIVERGSGFNRVEFDKNDIYAYGFATPAGADIKNDPHSSKYSNIWNIIEYNDPVPLVAPKEWGLDRYGTTKILPYREGNNDTVYKTYMKRIQKRLDDGNGYNIKKFTNYSAALIASFGGVNLTFLPNLLNHDTQGTALRKVVHALAQVIGDREKYNDKYEQIIVDCAKGDAGAHLYDIINRFIEVKIPQFILLHPHLSATLAMNLKTLAEVHADQDYYLGWMQLMDENYEYNLPQVWGNPDYRVYKANCPVDLFVYDEWDNMVASIENEEPLEEENGIIVSVDENGQKIAYLPVDGNYKVEVKARETCAVSCGIEEYNAEFGEPVRVVNFETVTLPAEESLSADIPAFSEDEVTEGAVEGSDVSYSMNMDDKVIDVESDIHGEEAIEAHTYNVSTVYDDTKGELYGGGSFTEGSFALIEYACKDGYVLDGFYIDGEKYDGSISEDHSIRIKVTKDTEVEARFVKSNDSTPTPTPTPTPAPSVTPAPQAPAEIQDLPAVKMSKPAAAKKSVNVKWKKVTKKNLKKIQGIEIQVATDPGFTDIVKTATAGKKKTSKKIKGLTSKQTYYVRIRAYKDAADGRHVSAWKAKKVKIK